MAKHVLIPFTEKKDNSCFLSTFISIWRYVWYSLLR